MARCCGSSGSCACKIDAGRMVEITGIGTSQDPFVISAVTELSTQDSDTFDFGLAGGGTLEQPWVLSLRFADSAKLSDLPDVMETPPTNGQVLGWDDAQQQWKPQAQTTAAAGSVTTDTSLSGDGSAGSPLQVREDAARYLASTAAGLGLSDDGINASVRIFPDATTRTNTTIAPAIGTVSTLLNKPGYYDFWDGDSWEPIKQGLTRVIGAGEFMAMSGSYAQGALVEWIGQVSATTDASGDFSILSSADLSGYAGVLTVSFTPTGLTPAVVMPRADTNRVQGRAFRVDTGAAYAGYAVTGIVRALLY